MPKIDGLWRENTGGMSEEMKTTELIDRLWRALNGSRKRRLSVAEMRLYRAVEMGLNRYAEDARKEWAEIGCEWVMNKPTGSVPLSASELSRLIRRFIDEGDTLPLSAAEQRFYNYLQYSLPVYQGSALFDGLCRICGVPG